MRADGAVAAGCQRLALACMEKAYRNRTVVARPDAHGRGGNATGPTEGAAGPLSPPAVGPGPLRYQRLVGIRHHAQPGHGMRGVPVRCTLASPGLCDGAREPGLSTRCRGHHQPGRADDRPTRDRTRRLRSRAGPRAASSWVDTSSKHTTLRAGLRLEAVPLRRRSANMRSKCKILHMRSSPLHLTI